MAKLIKLAERRIGQKRKKMTRLTKTADMAEMKHMTKPDKKAKWALKAKNDPIGHNAKMRRVAKTI